VPAILSGKNALVTGGAKRIGLAIASALAREGVNIILHYRSSGKEAVDVCSRLEEMGIKSWPISADFEKPEEYEGLIRKSALLVGGKVDILVNSASLFPQDRIEDIDYLGFTRSMQVNAWVPFVLGRELARLTGKGKIVNLVDSRVTSFDFSHTGYLWSKHVLLAMTRQMALELAPGVTVNGVNPGLILPPPGKDMCYLEAKKNTVPMKKHGSPDDIADAVIFLLKSDFITGEVINVDGGRHLWEYAPGPHPD
jgi:pteridine reductase